MLDKVEGTSAIQALEKRLDGWNKMLIALWAVVLGAVSLVMINYDFRAGAIAQAPANIALSSSNIKTEAGKPTLLFFAHPKCPCTRASIEELSKIMAQCKDIVAYGIVVVPPGAGADFGQGETIESLRHISDLHVIEDKDGVIADKFGARTSGQTVFYDHDGKLGFNGGITYARGHVGDNEGRTKIVSMVNRPAQACHLMQSTPVFGCGLKGDEYESSDRHKRE